MREGGWREGRESEGGRERLRERDGVRERGGEREREGGCQSITAAGRCHHVLSLWFYHREAPLLLLLDSF